MRKYLNSSRVDTAALLFGKWLDGGAFEEDPGGLSSQFHVDGHCLFSVNCSRHGKITRDTREKNDERKRPGQIKTGNVGRNGKGKGEK